MNHQKALTTLANERESFVRFARKRLPNEVDAEDVVQQALTRATAKIESLTEPERLFGWFYVILRHAVSDALRQRTRHDEGLDRYCNMTVAPEPIEPVQNLCACGDEIMASLPETWQDVLRMVDVEDQSVEVVARKLKTSPNNVRVKVHRARARMRDSIESHCGISSFEACWSCECA